MIARLAPLLLVAAAFLLAPATAGAATRTVTKTADTNDQVCSLSDCSLREAVEGAMAADTIVVPAGTYGLSPTFGQLDLGAAATIQGAGSATTIITAGGNSRVLNVSTLVTGPVIVSGVTITGGSTVTSGGGILAPEAALLVTDSVISNNAAATAGGGIYADSLALTRSTVSGNTVVAGRAGSVGGAGIFADLRGLDVVDSTVSGNTASLGAGATNAGGGGIHYEGRVASIVNSTLSGNSVTFAGAPTNGGGGAYWGGNGADSFLNVTVAGNSSPNAPGAGLYNASGVSSSLENSIVASNTASAGSGCGGLVSFTSLGNNLEFPGNTCNLVAAGDKPNTNPALGPLASNGGPTQTHALLPGSPAIDAAGTLAAGCPKLDQRGVVRPQGPACDMGAFEAVLDTAITGGPSGRTNDSTPTFTFSSTVSTFQCRVYSGSPSGTFTSCASPHTTTTLADGSYTLEVRAIDPAGNVDTTPASRAFIVDTVAPDTTISSGPTGLTSDSTPTFAFTSSEPTGATFECRVYSGAPSGAFAPCTSAHTTAALANGSYTFEVRASDGAGNVDPTPAQRSFSVGPAVAAPDTSIASAPPVVTTDRTPAFTFSSDVAGARFECSIDGGPFAPCTSPFATNRALRAGPHTFAVRAVNPAGVPDPTPATSVFVIPAVLSDLPPPRIGKTFNVEPLPGGEVLVSETAGASRARASATVPGIKGRNFVPLVEARQVAVGSILDTRKGKVRLLSARDARGTPQTGDFSFGVFGVLQSGKRAAKGLTELRLKGSSFRGCRKIRHGKKSSAARHTRRIRRLRGNGRGRFRTRGRYSAATVRGTVWEVSDRCDGTLTKVTRGKVAVRDFRRRKNVLVRAGKSYLARKRSSR